MRGSQPELEFRGIGVNVHLPSVALKAYVGGSRGQCWVELRYLLRHLQYSVSTCRWVKARSDWFDSSWSKRHMLTRADDVRDSDKHCRYVRRQLTMPTQEYLVSTRFVLTFLLTLACRGRGARQSKAVAMLTELFVASIGQVPKGGCFTTMVPTADVERTSVELCASLAYSGTSVVVDGSANLLRALESLSRANELVQFLKCCYEAEDDGVQVTTVTMLALGLASVVDNWFAGSGHTEDVAALLPRLPSKKRFQRVDSGTKLMCSIGAIRQKRAKTISSFVRSHRGSASFAGLAESRCRDIMVEVVANSVAWSRRVFASSDPRRICFSADEFNRESSRMILICRDLRSDILGYLPLQVMPHRAEKRAIVFFLFFFFDCFTLFFRSKTPKRHF